MTTLGRVSIRYAHLPESARPLPNERCEVCELDLHGRTQIETIDAATGERHHYCLQHRPATTR